MAPLDRLADRHRRCLQWASQPKAGTADALGAETVALLAGLDEVLHGQQAVEAGCLFPALIEAMAGSDAVCLRQMTQALAVEHQRLQAMWHGLRPRLLPAPGIAAPPLDAAAQADLDRFAALLAAHSRRMLAELLPMAARLLDDAATAALDQALQARRL